MSSNLSYNTSKDKSLQKALNRFYNSNEKHWRRFDNKKKGKLKDGHILVDCLTDHPAYIVSHCVIGKILSEKENCDCIGLTSKRDKKISNLCDSYRFRKTLELNVSRINHLANPINLIKAWALFRNINTKKQLLDLKTNGILVGDLIYNSTLENTKEGTVNVNSMALLMNIYRCILYINYFENLLSNYKFRGIVAGHLFYIPTGTLVRLALNRGIAVYSRYKGPVEIGVKKYKKPTDSKVHQTRVDPELIKLVEAKIPKRAEEMGTRVLKSRFQGKSSEVGAINAFNRKKLKLSRKKLVAEIGLDEDKPVVCIMSHIFRDAPHSNHRALFEDYQIWLEETFKHIKSIHDVNWIIKPHPSEFYYPQKLYAKDIAEKYGGKNLKFIGNHINTNALFNIVDIILTAKGSAGLEFPCFGIPSILVSEAFYSGFGFNIEPSSKEEYLNILSNIQKVQKLKRQDIRKARIVAFVNYCLTRVECEIIPLISQKGDYDEETAWQEAEKLVRKINIEETKFYEYMQDFLDSDRKNLINLGYLR